MIQNQNNSIKNEKIRYKSFIIANELRQSSDDLTNFCRLYVMTGDTTWKTKYWEVLDIRKGKLPRPGGRQISLRDSMQKLGFTKYEFDLLRSSEDNSNELVWIERVAFNSVKGIFVDSLGAFTIQNEPNIQYAQQIMFDEKYLEAKTKIMQPIDEFIINIDERTKNTVLYFRRIGYTLLNILIVILIFGILISLISYYLIRKRTLAQIKVDIALNESNLKFSKAFYNQPIAKRIINIDDGNQIEVNENFCKLSGYSKEELAETSTINSNLWADISLHKKLIEKLIISKQISDMPLDMITKSNEKRNLLVNAAILEMGENNWVIASYLDITLLKKTEEELKKHKENLEQIVKERTDEIESKNNELLRLNDLFTGREFRIKELRDIVKDLKKQIVDKRNK